MGSMLDTNLRDRVADFYNSYHRHRVRTPNRWMERTYYPLLCGRTLEVGGGTLLAKSSHYVLLDLSAEAVHRAVLQGVRSVLGDGCDLPFPSRSFETVACYDVLEHVVEPHRFLSEMCRVASRRVVVAGPNWVGRDPGGLTKYLPARVWSLLVSGGRVEALEDPHLAFDDEWSPDSDALSAVNAGWVAGRIREAGLHIRHLRSWEYGYHLLNRLPGLRCLGPFMFVVGERG